MTLFGKTPGDYVRFAGGVLLLILVVGLLRFGLYEAGIQQSGAPDATPAAPPAQVIARVKWLSMNAVMVMGAIYFGVRGRKRGFDRYAHLLPLNFLQGLTANWLIAAGILIAIYRQVDSIYSFPEFKGPHADGKTLEHALGHFLLAPFVITVAGSIVSAIAMLVTGGQSKRKVEPATVAPTSSAAPAAATPSSEPAPTVEKQGDGPVVH